MRKSLWMGGVIAVLSVAVILYGQAGARPPQSPINPQRAFLCVTCHNVDDNVAGLKLDTINLNRIADNAETWEIEEDFVAPLTRPAGAGHPLPSGEGFASVL